MKKQKLIIILGIVFLMSIGVFFSISAPACVNCQQKQSILDGWDLIADGIDVPDNPEVAEWVWEKKVGDSQYDKIRVRRMKLKSLERGREAIFVLSGQSGSAEVMLHGRDLAGNKFLIMNEETVFTYKFIYAGYDVYSLDYRSWFVPKTETDLAFMKEWGMEAFISDLHESVQLIKCVSGFKRVYLHGVHFAGELAMCYTTQHPDDVKGIILHDGGSGGKLRPGSETNTHDLAYELEQMDITGNYAYIYDIAFEPYYSLFYYAYQFPEAPSPVPGFDNVSDYCMFMLYSVGHTAFHAPYGSDAKNTLGIMLTLSPFFPYRLLIEHNHFTDWIDTTQMIDYDELFDEIDVPLIAFISNNPLVDCPYRVPYYIHGTKNPDSQGHILDGWGHIDMFIGKQSSEFIDEPLLEWVEDHRMLVGSGIMKTDSDWVFGDSIIFINSTHIDFQIVETEIRISFEITWTIVIEGFEVYEGDSNVGRIHIFIRKDYAIATGRNIFFYGYRT
ncbi:MAG: hypothetical protein JSV62_06620 [Promethearchaeota archaeon]|nr:MAG: hypothetical protein JSV62_06620 [Candidatus Lokiarchaeota archaeon]